MTRMDGRGEEENERNEEKEKLRRRTRGWDRARKSVKSSQFDTNSDSRTGGGNTLAYLVETIDDKGTGWSLDVWREGATRREDAIL